MKRNNLARVLFLLLILAWAGTEMTPLWDKPGKLIEEFSKSKDSDEAFDKVVAAVNASYETNKSNEFGLLYKAVEASGLALTNYFPRMNFGEQTPNNRLVLQALQKRVAGQIQLGLDLKGGSSFLVKMIQTSWRMPPARSLRPWKCCDGAWTLLVSRSPTSGR